MLVGRDIDPQAAWDEVCGVLGLHPETELETIVDILGDLRAEARQSADSALDARQVRQVVSQVRVIGQQITSLVARQADLLKIPAKFPAVSPPKVELSIDDPLPVPPERPAK